MNKGYRPEIDGLRAIAVISVVLYHFGLPGVSAGFVGVDVFFVISGYLITSQLWAARENPIGRLLSGFYARRARRILTPLVLVVITVLVLGKFLLLPTGEQQDLAKSGVATALFASNVFFLMQAGDYFAGPAETQLLLHTWSLAVEEQFYLVWPFLIAALWQVARRLPGWRPETIAGIGILLVSMLSLAISIAWTARNPGAAFFMMPSRLWELGCGAVLAVYGAKSGADARLPRFTDVAGLAAIAAAVFLLARSTPFPGIAALLPVAGTMLVIAAGAQGGSGAAYAFLASRPMRLTGEISYSWYLWHWPLLALGRAIDMGAHSLVRDAALVSLAYVLAYLSTRFIEAPIRSGRVAVFSQDYRSILSGLCLLCLTAGLSFALWHSARVHYRAALAPASLSCMGEIEFDAAGPCVLAKGGKASVFLVGDSHGNHWSPAVASWAEGAGASAVERSLSGCPVLLAIQPALREVKAPRYSEDCKTLSYRVMSEIRQAVGSTGATMVVIAAHWQADAALDEFLAERLDGALAELARAGATALVIGTTPQFNYSPPACMARRDARDCRIVREQYDEEAKAANAILVSIVARHPHARLWEPASSYCDTKYCYPSKDGQLMFRDQDHLSWRGAEEGGRTLRPELDRLLQSSLPKQPR